jgi:hypothetical protein
MARSHPLSVLVNGGWDENRMEEETGELLFDTEVGGGWES